MISSIKNLMDVLVVEKKIYFQTRLSYVRALILRERIYYTWQFQKNLRILEYIGGQKKGFLYAIISRRVNVLGKKLGIEIWCGCFDTGLHIYHPNGIVVNTNARVGKNCVFHGNNCIGNDGYSEKAPTIGDNCEFGVGAKVIGNIILANNIRIAAGAVVIRSCLESNVLLAGVPAKIVKKQINLSSDI